MNLGLFKRRGYSYGHRNNSTLLVYFDTIRLVWSYHTTIGALDSEQVATSLASLVYRTTP